MYSTFIRDKAIVLSCACALGACAATGGAPPQPGYADDTRAQVVKSAYGLCWRTPWWSPAAATETCDPEYVKTAAAPPPKPAPPPPPMAQPAPPPPPVAVVAPVTERITLSADVLFDFDKATIKPEGEHRLDELVEQLRGVSLDSVIATGHTDSIGTEKYNQGLSERRADSVKEYLISKGVGQNRIEAEGKGEGQPVADNRTAAGRAQNRRVELEVVGTKTR